MKKLQFYSLFLLIFFLFYQTTAHAILIDFDDLEASGGPTAITDQYQSLGVVFEDLFIVDESTNPFYTSGAGSSEVSLSNVGQINDENPFSLSVTAIFNGTTDFIQATFFDSEIGTQLIKMIAYDILGNIIDIVDVVTPAQQFSIVGISAAGIHKVVMETDSDGAGIDNFTFNSTQEIPEPTPISLFILCIAGLIFWRRKTVSQSQEQTC